MISAVQWLAKFLPPETERQIEPRLFGTMFVSSFLGIGLYWSWLYAACFSTRLFPEGRLFGSAAASSQTVSYVGYMAVLACALFFTLFGRSLARSRALVVAASITASLGTLLVSCSFWLEGSASASVAVGGSLMTGLGTGVFLTAWGTFYARHLVFAPVQIASGLLVSAVVTAGIVALPFPAASACMVVLPLACGACCCVANEAAAKAQTADEASEPRESDASAASSPFPWRPCSALALTGVVFGFMLALGFEKMQMGSEMALACAVVNAVIGLLVLAYTGVSKQSFGFSTAYLAVLPLAVFGVLVFVAFGADWVFVAFLAVRAAYVLFDVMTWMQLPRIQEKTGSIRVFIESRVALEGGFGIGLLAFKAFLAGERSAFDWALVLTTTLLCAVCLAAFMNNNFENAWGLLVEPKESKHRLRFASKEIAEQHKLTKREEEVMMLMLRGKNGPYIQEKLCISQNTYQTHTRNLYRKLDVHSRQELFDLLDEKFAEIKESQ